VSLSVSRHDPRSSKLLQRRLNALGHPLLQRFNIRPLLLKFGVQAAHTFSEAAKLRDSAGAKSLSDCIASGTVHHRFEPVGASCRPAGLLLYALSVAHGSHELRNRGKRRTHLLAHRFADSRTHTLLLILKRRYSILELLQAAGKVGETLNGLQSRLSCLAGGVALGGDAASSLASLAGRLVRLL
jgi:hypothetical protein